MASIVYEARLLEKGDVELDLSEGVGFPAGVLLVRLSVQIGLVDTFVNGCLKASGCQSDCRYRRGRNMAGQVATQAIWPPPQVAQCESFQYPLHITTCYC
jgi:hypothetical protein